MALFSFYNVRKPRQFNHKPIYWDPHKEAMEERVRKMKRENRWKITSRRSKELLLRVLRI